MCHCAWMMSRICRWMITYWWRIERGRYSQGWFSYQKKKKTKGPWCLFNVTMMITYSDAGRSLFDSMAHQMKDTERIYSFLPRKIYHRQTRTFPLETEHRTKTVGKRRMERSAYSNHSHDKKRNRLGTADHQPCWSLNLENEAWKFFMFESVRELTHEWKFCPCSMFLQSYHDLERVQFYIVKGYYCIRGKAVRATCARQTRWVLHAWSNRHLFVLNQLIRRVWEKRKWDQTTRLVSRLNIQFILSFSRSSFCIRHSDYLGKQYMWDQSTSSSDALLLVSNKKTCIHTACCVLLVVKTQPLAI